MFSDTPEAIAARQASRNGAKKKETWRKLELSRWVWKRWKDLWLVLNSDPGPKSNWNAHADAVKVLADKFVLSYTDLHKASQGLYLHMLVAHIPGQIRIWGDLRLRQTQGLEHGHKLRKRIGLESTNRKRFARMKQVLTHVAVLAYLRRLRDRSTQAREHAAGLCVKEMRLKAKVLRLAATMPTYCE